MRVRSTIFVSLMIAGLLISTAGVGENLPGSASTGQTSAVAAADPLLQLLVSKGVLSSDEAQSLTGTPGQQRVKLLELLKAKGILSASDYAELAPVSAQVEPNLVASSSPILPVLQKEPGPITVPLPAPAATVVPAIAPLRTLPVDPPKKDGLNAAFKMGPVKMTPYGFIKATAAYDTSSPNGDDFPFIGLFLGSTNILSTGPTRDPEFHIKARSTRLGANLEWPDISSKLTLTGRVEGDYEGNFSEVDNRDVTSLRSNMFQLRLAYVRMDYQASEKTDLYFQGGQDWTIFGSSALPPILETTFLGAFYGSLYTRSPQFQFGVVQSLGGSRNFKFSPTFALMMPSSGEIEKLGSLGLAGQIAQAEREGADSGRPEVEARLALQFQLDKAKGVAPAQILWSGFQGRRTSIVSSGNAPYCDTDGCFEPTVAESTYFAAHNGFTTSSKMYGNQLAVQLPTRWFTLVASAYRGADMRFFLAGQVESYFTDMNGLSNPVVYTTLDGGPLVAAGSATLATDASGNVVVAPQKPIRSFGGFISLGLPLSRWFNADPKGHNAGWQLYFTVGKDQVVDRDLNNPGATGIGCIQSEGVCTGVLTGANDSSPLPLAMGKMFAGTLNYKLNPFITFSLEQSIYATRLQDGLNLYSIAGVASNEWQDHRTEFGPIFTF
ncbi:MAG TPA: hypothetical protein VMU80_29135 [Bryobacteraceae bacterium]|nr:hypothetical protein [Bryobacteraceae bacterium]